MSEFIQLSRIAAVAAAVVMEVNFDRREKKCLWIESLTAGKRKPAT